MILLAAKATGVKFAKKEDMQGGFGILSERMSFALRTLADGRFLIAAAFLQNKMGVPRRCKFQVKTYWDAYPAGT